MLHYRSAILMLIGFIPGCRTESHITNRGIASVCDPHFGRRPIEGLDRQSVSGTLVSWGDPLAVQSLAETAEKRSPGDEPQDLRRV